MEPPASSRHGNVVRTVFPHAIALFDYCSSVVNFTADQKLVYDHDTVSYKDLLHNTLIIPPNNGIKDGLKFNISRIEKFPIRDMIGRLVSLCVRNNPSYQDQNCLALGYRNKTSNCDATLRTSNDTELYFVNTVQAIVTTQTWQLFANRVGEEVIRHIFSLSVFVQGANMCYIQVSGIPASELVYKELKYQQEESKLKKNAVSSSNRLIMACNRIRKIGIKKELLDNISQNKNKNEYIGIYCTECRKPMDILSVTKALARYRIFYSAKYEKELGLPGRHPLRKGVQKCNNMVDSVFLTALSLLKYDQSVSQRETLIDVFRTIRSAYTTCPIAELMEKYCALSDVIEHAEPLLPAQQENQEQGEEGDTSALFATPVTPASNHLCCHAASQIKHSGEEVPRSQKRQRTAHDATSSALTTTSSSTGGFSAASPSSASTAGNTNRYCYHSTAHSSATKTERDDSTLHSSVRSTSHCTLLPNTLTQNSSREHPYSDNAILSNTLCSAMLTLTNTTHTHTTTTPSLSINNTTIRTCDNHTHSNNNITPTTTTNTRTENNQKKYTKKHRRGCRAGKRVKNQQNNSKSKPNISVLHTNANDLLTEINNKTQIKNSLAYEIHKNIELLCKTYTERPLVTVGESIVNRIVESARRGQEYEREDICTQQSALKEKEEKGQEKAGEVSSSSLPLPHPAYNSNSNSSIMKKDVPEVAALATAATSAGGLGLLGDSEETTYASIPSVSHFPQPPLPLNNDSTCSQSNSERKRKYVSICPLSSQQRQQSPEYSTASTSVREEEEGAQNISNISRGSVGRAEHVSLQHSQGDFQYICDDSATPSTAPRKNTSSLGRSSCSHAPQHLRFSTDTPASQHPPSNIEINNNSKTILSQLKIPACPNTIGNIQLKAYKSNRRKKIKAKFRSLLRHQLSKLPLLQQHKPKQKRNKLEEESSSIPMDSIEISPILPNTMDSGLKYHLNRPYLTEANHSSLKRKFGDPRSALFPSQPPSQQEDSELELGLESVDLGLQTNKQQKNKKKRMEILEKIIKTSDLLTLNTPTHAVASFVKSVCLKVFSYKTIWGNRRNQAIFLSAVDGYIHLGRHESFQLKHVITGMRLTDIPWLKNNISPPRCRSSTGNLESSKRDGLVNMENSIVVDIDTSQYTQCSNSSSHRQSTADSSHDYMGTETLTENKSISHSEAAEAEVGTVPQAASPLPTPSRLSAAEVLAREQLFFRFVDWVFSDFINPLVSSCFYVTEVEGRGTEVYYYRKPVWAGIIQRGKQQLFSNFVPLVCTEESHLAAAVVPSLCSLPAKSSFPPHAATNHTPTVAVAPIKENSLQRAATAPASSSSCNPAPASSTLLHRTGSLLFNEILHTNQRNPAPSLAEQNISIISHLPSIRTSINASTPHTNTKLKKFLGRLPLVRFVPKKNSVRAITNLRTKRNSMNSTTTGLQSYSNSFNTTTTTTTATTTPGQVCGEVLTNTSLYNCLHVLKSVYSNRPQLAGFGTFGLDDIYLKFLKYKQQLVTTKPELFNTTTTHSSRNNVSTTALPKSQLPSHFSLPTQQNNSTATPKFYIAVLDLEKCYDNVDPQRLYSLMKNILSTAEDSSTIDTTTTTTTATTSNNNIDKTYSKSLTTDNVIHKYSVTHPIKSMDRNITKNIRCVTSNGEIVPFKEAAAEIAESYPYSIITDAVVYPKISNQEVLRLLRIHLFQHAVKIPTSSSSCSSSMAQKKNTNSSSSTTNAATNSMYKSYNNNKNTGESSFDYYTQIKGIPQGSVLSPLLCTLYYGHAETTLFHAKDTIELIGLVDKTLIVRLMDDYIIISIDQHCIEAFLQLAHEGLKQYGAGINPLKTKTNFNTSITINGEIIKLNQINSLYMPWCGLLINTKNLEILCNFERILDRPIINSILIEYLQAGKGLKRVIKTFMRMKCHAIVLDMSINQKHTVIKTLYTMYIIVAIRTITYIKYLQKYNTGSSTSTASTTTPTTSTGTNRMNVKHVYKCIAEGIDFGARLIHTRTVKKSTRKLHLGSHPTTTTASTTTSTANHMNNYELNKEFQNNNLINKDGISTTAEDLELFASCIESADPEHFGHCAVNFWEACWLGTTAFIRALEYNRAQYSPLIRRLQCLRRSYSSHFSADAAAATSQPILTLSGEPDAAAGILQECEGILETCQWG